MRYGSVCSGIEAATAAWHHMGWEPAFFSEIEAFPCAVLQHHYPEVPLHGDFTTIEKNQYGQIDLLVGGTPCQSFSVAGLRGGLDDERGNLALEFCRLAQREQPRWIVWENVPGVLSSNGGRDFGSILGALEDLGYGLAYRVLDAQYFGVAQRRRRVFVVGYLGDWRPAAAVLFERHSMSGHPAPSREARKEAARAASVSTHECGGIGSYSESDVSSPLLRTGTDKGHGCEALIARGGGLAVNISNGEPRLADITGTLDCWSMKGRGSSQQQAVLTGPLFVPDTANAITASLANSATGHNKDENVIAFDAYNQAETEGVSKTVAARNDQDTASCVAYAIQERAVCENPNAGPDGVGVRSDDCAYTLEARSTPQAVAFQSSQSGVRLANTHATLDANNGPRRHNGVLVRSAVRRLTPVECERLQGFPSNFTAIPWKKKGPEQCPDGPRYKALGNSMAVPVMRWIGERIQLVDDLISVL